MDVDRFEELPDHGAICDDVSQFFEHMRRSLEESGAAISKHIGGLVPANPVDDERTDEGLRKLTVVGGEVTFEKPLPSGFTLVVKHNAAFAAVIPELAKRYVCHHPQSGCGSFVVEHRLDACQEGHSPLAENIDPGLRTCLVSIRERLDRQVHLLSWFFDQSAPYRRSGSSATKTSSQVGVAVFAPWRLRPQTC